MPRGDECRSETPNGPKLKGNHVSTKLVSGVWWMDIGHVNAYLAEADGLTLIDAGMPWHADAIRDALASVGFEVADIERVLVTHYDLDHVGGLGRLPDLDAPIYVGTKDADFVTRRHRPPVTNRKNAFQRLTDVLRDPPSAPVTPVSDGAEIGEFTAIHTPGHTEGHVTFVAESSNVAFVGDLVRSDGDELRPTPWPVTRDRGAVRESIDRLVREMAPIDVVAPGHGEPIVDDGFSTLRDLARGRGH